MNAYIVLSLLTGARTEELRALTWDHLDLDANPPTIMVWRSDCVGPRRGEIQTILHHWGERWPVSIGHFTESVR